jgi:hypothetical protein
MYAGRTNRLTEACVQILAGKEVVVPGMVDGPVDDLVKKRAGRWPPRLLVRGGSAAGGGGSVRYFCASGSQPAVVP